jgi:hypothetical protein
MNSHTDYVSISGPFTLYQKSRGIDTSLRVEIDLLNNKNINE